jgi:microcystin-dependent protein
VANVSITNNFNLIPPGTIIMNISSTTILGYFLCDGSSYPTSIYSNLFSIIAYSFGGSGTTFKVPDFRGAFLRGCGTNGSYSYTGSSIGSAQADTIGSHSHTISSPNPNYQYGNNSGSYGSTTGTKSVTTTGNYSALPSSTDTSGSSETRPFNYSVYYFIKW